MTGATRADGSERAHLHVNVTRTCKILLGGSERGLAEIGRSMQFRLERHACTSYILA